MPCDKYKRPASNPAFLFFLPSTQNWVPRFPAGALRTVNSNRRGPSCYSAEMEAHGPLGRVPGPGYGASTEVGEIIGLDECRNLLLDTGRARRSANYGIG